MIRGGTNKAGGDTDGVKVTLKRANDGGNEARNGSSNLGRHKWSWWWLERSGGTWGLTGKLGPRRRRTAEKGVVDQGGSVELGCGTYIGILHAGLGGLPKLRLGCRFGTLEKAKNLHLC